jgi:hypothetical protein
MRTLIYFMAILFANHFVLISQICKWYLKMLTLSIGFGKELFTVSDGLRIYMALQPTDLRTMGIVQKLETDHNIKKYIIFFLSRHKVLKVLVSYPENPNIFYWISNGSDYLRKFIFRWFTFPILNVYRRLR